MLVNNLNGIWISSSDRLKSVIDSDPQLSNIVSKEQKGMRLDMDGLDHRSVLNDDMRSEYSRASNMSFRSNASSRSGLSTVSVLSSLSRYSNASSTVSDTSSFSIRGIEHSLLSRGSAEDSAGKVVNHKQKKRNERHMKGNKGGAHGGADIYNLKGENAWCTELCKYCDIVTVAAAIADIRDTLMLLGSSDDEDIAVAVRLQTEMNVYTALIAANPPPTAPLYPVEWLRRKNMEFVRCFQEWPAADPESVATLSTVNNTTLASLLWWKIAAQGIVRWRHLKSSVLE